MLPKRLYNLLLGLFPIVFAIHNLEEWLVFNSNIGLIVKLGPKFISDLMAKDSEAVSSIFGTALIVATLMPLLATIVFLNKVSVLNIKILVVVAFVTLINALSHIFSSVSLGFISPGFITGILLCIPYSIAVLLLVSKYIKFTFRLYFLLGLGSIAVYALGLGLAWVIGFLFS